MYKLNKDKSKAILTINNMANLCGYFFNAHFDEDCDICPNNGYNCKHPECEEKEQEIGCCYAFSCPLGWEADKEDCEYFGFEYEEGEFIVTDNLTILDKLK